MINSGADIIDIGGESTRPGSKIIPSKIEWQRIKKYKKFKKKFPKILLSIDTRKSLVMKNAIKYKADIINDVSCFKFDKNSLRQLKIKIYGKLFIICKVHHKQCKLIQNINHVLLDIYDFFEKEIEN